MKILLLGLIFLTLILTLVNPKEQCTDESRVWIDKNIIGIHQIDKSHIPPICYIVSKFYNRMINYEKYKMFYDDFYKISKNRKKYPYFIDLNDGLYFVILQEKEKLTDLPPYEQLRGKTVEDIFGYIGDHRLMDDVAGEGTRQTVIIKSNELHHLTHGYYNTFYHEFAHFVHLSLLTQKEFERLEFLYEQAKALNQFLDDYSAHNSSEYFAQGLEAYLSITKSNLKYKTTKHTKEDLKLKDPDLFRFIQKFELD